MSDMIPRLNAALEGRYRVERELAEGGMATVYLATDLRHQRQVALKVLKPELAAALGGDRFLAEIRTTANLQHPHILPLHDSGSAGGHLFFVMPYVEGETLQQRMERPPTMSVEEAVGIAIEVAEGLHAAHEKGVIHRDLKPANILLTGGRPLVADFGIAYAADRLGDEKLTDTGLSLGTPYYMSPEQISGEAIDRRSDVYGLACVLYEMLSGAPPFGGPTRRAILAGHVAGPVPRLETRGGKVPEALEAAVRRGLEKAPEDRFPDTMAFARALRAAMKEVSLAPDRRRRRSWLAAGGALATILLFGLWIRPLLIGDRTALDPNRILVFPLVVSEGFPGASSAGEDVATLIGNAVDGTGPLRWIDGWVHLPPELRDDVRGLTDDQARAIAVEQRCRHYMTGRITAAGDSAVISLVLNDLGEGTDPVRAQATAPLEEPWRGVRAVNRLLPELIPGGAPDALAGWSERPPRAIASYLLGEAAFRRIRLEEALRHYRAAVEADSSFAMAAIRGAQAASWAHSQTEAAALLETALRQPLEPRHAAFARGYQAYLEGRADSAIAALHSALALDPEMAPAWLQLGETWTHLLPAAGVPDDSALEAFGEIIRRDSTAAEPLFHTIQILLRRGEVERAGPLVSRLTAGDPEGSYADAVGIMLQCVRGGPDQVPWDDLATNEPFALFSASMQLASAGAQLPCAKAGFSAILRGDTALNAAADGRRFWSMFSLQNALLAEGRAEAAAAQVTAFVDRWGGGASLFLLGAPVFEEYVPQARVVAAEDARRHGPAYQRLEFPIRLWELGVFEARLGNPETAAMVAKELRSRAAAGRLPVGGVLAASIEAHMALAGGDTASALERFEALVPAVASSDDVQYDEPRALGLERLEYARLLVARGRNERAIQVANVFDSPSPIVHLLYLRPSLVIRAEAASALGDRRLEESFRARIRKLDGGR